MRVLITSLVSISLFLFLVLTPVGSEGVSRAQALSLGGLVSGVSSLLGGGGGQVVQIISDVSKPALESAIRNTLTAISTNKISGDIAELIFKEMKLDPNSWNIGKQLQQQLTAEMLKWLGGQQPGQNGEVPFVQNYAEHFQNQIDHNVGDYLYNDRAGDTSRQCNQEKSHRVIVSLQNGYADMRQRALNGGALKCGGEDFGQYDTALDKLLGDFLECRDELCSYFAGMKELADRNAIAIANERDAINNARGFKPQRICDEVEDADGRVRRRCDIVNPPSLAADAAAFNLIELPGLSLLNIDEFDEVISNLMSNLTNQAIGGLTGVLGLSGNPNYSQNVFGDNGDLSYAEALARDDLSKYQSGTARNPIEEARKAEQDYYNLQSDILAIIAELEARLENNTEEFNGCFDMELPQDLVKTKEESTLNLNVSSTTLAILTNLNQQYASSTDTFIKNSVLSTFTQLKNQGFFRTSYQNEELKITFIDLTFAQWVNKFLYDMSEERVDCGGSADYDDILTSSSTPSV